MSSLREEWFFECIDDKETAFTLFDCCAVWLKKNQDIEAMDGPINFGERYQWWGLLVDGFHRPVYGISYSLPCYQNLFESYGFKTFFLTDSLSEIIAWKAKRLESNPDYSIVHFKKKNISKFIKYFVHIYNEEWVSYIPGVDFMTKGYAFETFNAMESV